MAKRRKAVADAVNGGQQLPTAGTHTKLDTQAMEQWLWDAACAIRGATDAPKFKDFILPLIFYKRLSDVFDDELAEKAAFMGDRVLARVIVDEDHEAALKEGRKPVVRCYIPSRYEWDAIRLHPANGKLGEFVTDAMRDVALLNPSFQGVLDVIDFAARQAGQRLLDDDRLYELVKVINRHRLGLRDTSPDILGHAYEYLLRKFAEGQGQSAGEFYTPMEVGHLMARLLDPIPKATVYDPTCGSGGLLIKMREVYGAHHADNAALEHRVPQLYGQELNPATFALAKMNMFLHDFAETFILAGDTFKNPQFRHAGVPQRFDYVVANPMWNQNNYAEKFYEDDPLKRFTFGYPPNGSADWGWVQHIYASLTDTGRAAVVLDTGAVSRGSGSRGGNKEKEIRKAFVEADLIEGVVLLPENLFYNTTAPGIVLLLNRRKADRQRGTILLVNASLRFQKRKPKNVLTADGLDTVAAAYAAWQDVPKLCKVVTNELAAAADYNLSPSQFVEVNDRATHRPLATILNDLEHAKRAREAADEDFREVISSLSLPGTAS